MSEFVDYLHEVFEQFGVIRCRRMFGGYGVYHDGIMFALVAGDTLYLKADPDTAGYFEARSLPRFEYHKGDKVVRMSYYMAPEEILENPEDAAVWARRAFAAALRAKSPANSRQGKLQEYLTNDGSDRQQ